MFPQDRKQPEKAVCGFFRPFRAMLYVDKVVCPVGIMPGILFACRVKATAGTNKEQNRYGIQEKNLI